jgi:hypothetical protein
LRNQKVGKTLFCGMFTKNSEQFLIGDDVGRTTLYKLIPHK